MTMHAWPSPDRTAPHLPLGFYRYVPAVLPALSLEEKPMPTALADYLVMLSEIHGGGDMRKLGDSDRGAYDVMKSYQLKENPGYVQSHFSNKKKTTTKSKTEL